MASPHCPCWSTEGVLLPLSSTRSDAVPDPGTEHEYCSPNAGASTRSRGGQSSASPRICGSSPRSPWAIAAIVCRLAEVVVGGQCRPDAVRQALRGRTTVGFRLAPMRYGGSILDPGIQLRSLSPIVKMVTTRQPEEVVLQFAARQSHNLGAR